MRRDFSMSRCEIRTPEGRRPRRLPHGVKGNFAPRREKDGADAEVWGAAQPNKNAGVFIRRQGSVSGAQQKMRPLREGPKRAEVKRVPRGCWMRGAAFPTLSCFRGRRACPSVALCRHLFSVRGARGSDLSTLYSALAASLASSSLALSALRMTKKPQTATPTTITQSMTIRNICHMGIL